MTENKIMPGLVSGGQERTGNRGITLFHATMNSTLFAVMFWYFTIMTKKNSVDATSAEANFGLAFTIWERTSFQMSLFDSKRPEKDYSAGKHSKLSKPL